MAIKNSSALPWKIIALSAFLLAGGADADAAEASRSAVRRGVIASQPPKTAKTSAQSAAGALDSDLWPMRGPTPPAPALSSPEQRLDGYYQDSGLGVNDYVVPVDVMVEATAVPHPDTAYDGMPAELVYGGGEPAQSRFDSEGGKTSEGVSPHKKGLRLRRRRTTSPDAAEKRSPAGGGDSYVSVPYDPYDTLSVSQPEWTQWDAGALPEIIQPVADTETLSPSNAIGEYSPEGLYYDKYHNVTSTYHFDAPEAEVSATASFMEEAYDDQPQDERKDDLAAEEAAPEPESNPDTLRPPAAENSGKQERQEAESPAPRQNNVEPPQQLQQPQQQQPQQRQPQLQQPEQQHPEQQFETGERQAPSPQSFEQPNYSYDAPPPSPASVQRGRQAPQQPNRAEVEDYRQRLELRLLERYNNLPEYAGNVGRVEVVLSRPIEQSLDGSRLKAEFDQLVYDPWGRRIPKLEEEYFVVTFAAGGAKQVRSDPSVRVGLDHEKGFSERMPLAADPFANVQNSKAFAPAPKPKDKVKKMAGWWRPDFPELD